MVRENLYTALHDIAASLVVYNETRITDSQMYNTRQAFKFNESSNFLIKSTFDTAITKCLNSDNDPQHLPECIKAADKFLEILSRAGSLQADIQINNNYPVVNFTLLPNNETLGQLQNAHADFIKDTFIKTLEKTCSEIKPAEMDSILRKILKTASEEVRNMVIDKLQENVTDCKYSRSII